MSPYLRGRIYYTRPTISGERQGPWSCGTANRKLAEGVEQTIRDLPLTCPQLIPHLISGRLSPIQIRSAALVNGLPDLVQMVEMRPLDLAIRDCIKVVSDKRVREGGATLVRLVADERKERGERGEPTVAWLRDPRNVRAILVRREHEGVKRNTVCRGVKVFVSALLKAEGVDPSPILRNAEFHKERDRRNVRLVPEQIERLFESVVEEEYRHIMVLAITTGIDLSPILRIQPEDFEDPVLMVRDMKTTSRPRQIALGEVGCVTLRTAIARKNALPGERVFTLSQTQCRDRWRVVRTRAGLPHLRFKDLRGVWATFAVRSGASVKELQALMGHANPSMSIEYASVVNSEGLMSRIEQAMGLRRIA